MIVKKQRGALCRNLLLKRGNDLERINMKTRIIGMMVIFLMIIFIHPMTSFETDFTFDDVSEKDWYYADVQKACESDFMEGFEDDTFRPEIRMTYAQIVKIASGLKQSYTEEKILIKEDDPHWYDGYVDYAREHDIIVKDYPWNAPATRADFAEILVNSLMDSTILPQNMIEKGMIPDVPADHEQASSIYKLYRAGVMTGSNAEGNFYPDKTIQRCEVAAVLTRIIDETVRKDITMVFAREPQESISRTASIREGVKIPVLLYHGVSNRVWGLDYLFVSPNNMRQQLQWLKDNGYETVFFSDLTHLSDYQKPILLTFDDGYDGNYTNLFPLLQEYNMKATIFVVSDEIGNEHRMDKYQLREMSDSGLVSIQSHTKSHVWLDTLNKQQLIKECQESRTTIGEITGELPYAISYPEGRHNALSDSVVKDYYSLGVLDRNGPWISNRKTRYQITRTIIPREFTIEQFVTAVKK